ncbi:hypothetical protein B0J13DRAFT_333292 [Dactylonectria estremocensis]|uniref:Chromo domain-containing protein n=1 Tax=Dactylonectria estremocensis TaxID=1079267 RepID=A0A9P9CX12_9HYPO|nr:hypothetical protein B0J13DRAFT_333292 [Dactylonectria estremocensis]
MTRDDTNTDSGYESLPDYVSDPENLVPDYPHAPLDKVESPIPSTSNITVDFQTDVTCEEWEVIQILGEKEVDGIKYYAFDWKPSWVPEHDAENAKELIQAWQEQKSKRQNKGRKKRNTAQRTGDRGKWALLESGERTNDARK